MNLSLSAKQYWILRNALDEAERNAESDTSDCTTEEARQSAQQDLDDYIALEEVVTFQAELQGLTLANRDAMIEAEANP